MVALRLYAVGLLLMPVRAEAAAPWNSTDMSHKTSADKKKQAQKASELHALRAASGTADSLLSGNKTTLETMQEQLKSAESKNFGMAQAINDTTAKLQQAEKDLAQKAKVQEEGIKMANETAESLGHAHAALSEVETTKAQKNAANNTASVNLVKAQNTLQEKVICCVAEVPAAKHEVEVKNEDLANASAALAEAEKDEAAKQKALELAEANNTKAVKARAEAKKAYQDAVGVVHETETYLEKLKRNDADPQKVIAEIKAAVEKQEGVVNTLTNTSKELHNGVDAKKSEYDNISAVVDHDVKCISRLQDREGALETDTLRVNKSMDAYESAPAGTIGDSLKPALWQLRDQEAVAANALYKVQKECAPKNITVPKVPPVPDCPDDTGGTCAWLDCHTFRNAVCCDKAHKGQPFCPDSLPKPTYQCVCPPGTCAKGGVCQDRGSPVLLASPSTELRAEPAAAGTVLAAAALMVTALLVMRGRRAPEIHMPENAYWLLA